MTDNIIETKKKKKKSKGFYDGAWNQSHKKKYQKYDPPGTKNKNKSANPGFIG